MKISQLEQAKELLKEIKHLDKCIIDTERLIDKSVQDDIKIGLTLRWKSDNDKNKDVDTMQGAESLFGSLILNSSWSDNSSKTKSYDSDFDLDSTGLMSTHVLSYIHKALKERRQIKVNNLELLGVEI